MKTKLFLFLFIAAAMFVSCEETEPAIEVTNTVTKYFVAQVSHTNGTLSGSDTYTYNEDNQPITIVNVLNNNTNTFTLEYDEQGQLIKVYKDDVIYAMYSYVNGEIKYSSYYNGEFMSKTTYQVNANNKVIREQSEGSEYYTTYTWEDDNMITNTIHSPDGEETVTTYTYNKDILAPGYNMYFSYKHPCFSSKNVYSEDLFSYNNEITKYTLTANDEGYLYKKVFTNILGVSTSTYSYNAVEFAE